MLIMGGIEVIEYICENVMWDDIFILVMIVNVMEVDKKCCIDVGM